jgi:hypothetical protein
MRWIFDHDERKGPMTNNDNVQLQDKYPWLYSKPDPQEVLRIIEDEVRRTLTATTSPPGYGPALDRSGD